MNKTDATLHSLGFRKLYPVRTEGGYTVLYDNKRARRQRVIRRMAVVCFALCLMGLAFLFAGCVDPDRDSATRLHPPAQPVRCRTGYNPQNGCRRD